MKKIIKFIVIIFILWIGIKFLYNKLFTFDNTEASLIRMMLLIPLNEQAQFINDFEIVSDIYGGEYKLIGLNIEGIKSEAIKIRKLTNGQNILFLEEFIKKLLNSNKSSTYLHITKFGRMYEPQMGYSYKQKYSIEELNNILENLRNN